MVVMAVKPVVLAHAIINKQKSLKVMKSKDEDLVDCGIDVGGSLFCGLVVRVMEVVKMWW